MARTIRNIPKQGRNLKAMRTPRHRWKIRAGLSRKKFSTDWDDKPIAALCEVLPSVP